MHINSAHKLIHISCTLFSYWSSPLKLGYALSPCCEISSPSCSSRLSTRSVVNNLTIATHIKVPTTATAADYKNTNYLCSKQVIITKYKSIPFAVLFIDFCVNIPVAIPPQIPPIPWQPKASSASSILSFFLIRETPK